MDPLVREMKEMRKMIEIGAKQTPLQPVPSLPVWPTSKGQTTLSRTNNERSAKEKAFDMAKRCVGLGPISYEVVNHHVEASNQTLDFAIREQIGGAFAVRDFLCKEMGMNDGEAENIRIVRTFRVPKQANVLYVEVAVEADIRQIRGRASYMSKGNTEDPSLHMYIPNVLQPQYLKLVNFANKGRAQIPKKASKIWVGVNTFELRFRPKGDHTPWNKIQPVEVDDPTPHVTRLSLINERAITASKPKSASTHLNQPPTRTPKSPTTFFTNNTNNPNLIPVAKERTKVVYLGETLLPKPISTSNKFAALQGTEHSSP